MYIYCENYQEAPYNYYHYDLPLKWFGPLSHLNVLIGPNNCGKSRFLRSILFEINNQGNLAVCMHDDIFRLAYEILSFVDKIKMQFTTKVNVGNYINNNNLLRKPTNSGSVKITGVNVFVEQQFLDEIKESITDLLTKRNLEKNKLLFQREFISFVSNFKENDDENIDQQFAIQLVKLFNQLSKLCSLLPGIEYRKLDVQIHYITIPRTLQRFKSSSDSDYVNENFINHTLRDQYNFKSDKIILHTGVTLYETIKLIRNGAKDGRKQFDKFEKFLKDNFFQDSDEIDIVAKLSKVKAEEHIDVYIDGRNHPIYELGDGVQAAIMVLFPLFTCEDGAYVFIEEPENNLHPHYQRILIQKINEIAKKRNLTIIMTTQSNHFLDLSSDIDKEVTIHTLKKIMKETPIFRIENVQSKDRNILRLLGINNASVFMANCSVWVEGITDRKYIQKYLCAYYESEEFKSAKLKKYKEGINYSFFEYAGLNLIHYLFDDISVEKDDRDKINVQFLSNKIFLVADKDKGKKTKHDYYTKLNNDYFQYYPLRCNEIENLLSKDQIVQILKNFEATKDKIEITTFYRDNYKNIGLGKALDDIFKISVFKSDSGTLKSYYKSKFIEIFSQETISWKLMSQDAKDLIIKMYVFINKHNSI